MDYTPPSPADSPAPADWLAGRIDLRRDDRVAGTVGSGFSAYARVFHPIDTAGSSRWADVAARAGVAMRAGIRWEDIAGDAGDSGDSGDSGDRPRDGTLEQEALKTLCDVLARYTPGQPCYFAVWDGWGWEHPGASIVITFASTGAPAAAAPAPTERQLDLAAPRFSLPWRDYLLYTGDVHDATRIGHWVTATWFDPQSPSMFWPADHSWTVATEIDENSTLVGGSTALVDAVLAAPGLEAWPIMADTPF